MIRMLMFAISIIFSISAHADAIDEKKSVERAVLDYIESQHNVSPDLMRRGLDEKLAKRTFWVSKDGAEYVMETNYETMISLAETFNKDGSKFPENPKVEITVFDIDNRTASVKLVADEWIDYMHLYKNDSGEWKIINVLWQYHDVARHRSKK